MIISKNIIKKNLITPNLDFIHYLESVEDKSEYFWWSKNQSFPCYFIHLSAST